MNIIIPVTKGPHPQGRIGPLEWQDWYLQLVRTVSLSCEMSAGILVISDVHIDGAEHEAYYYCDVLYQLGCSPCSDFTKLEAGQYIDLRECQETIGQMERVKEICHEYGFNPIFVSTWFHYFRVRWLTRGMKATHYVSFGLPRLLEAITDMILTFAFPVIDLAGKRRWFQEKIVGRRESGKH